MNKKRITLKEWTYIGKLNHAAKWCRPLCAYTLIKESDTTFRRDQRMNIIAYILIFIPVHILQAFVCMWDGGLREFTILNRMLGYDILSKGSLAFDKAEAVWNGTVEIEKEQDK